jgi:peptidoglycan biosynthesis protein MviN/MurJ (putative lipid II flippase)
MSLKYFSLSKVSRASVMLAFFYFLSRLVGLWRDRILASRFGLTIGVFVTRPAYSAFVEIMLKGFYGT